MPMIIPAADGHTHELIEIVHKDIEEDESTEEEEVAASQMLFTEAKNLNGKSIENAIKSEDFFKGEQWEENEKAKLKAENRACLVINEIKPKLDTLSGYQRQNRMDLNLLPLEGGDETTANIFSLCMKNIQQVNNFDYEESLTFDDTARVGIGAMQVFIKSSDRGIGEIGVANHNWKNFLPGPHSKLDGSDMEYCILKTPISKAKLKKLYPDKADEINKDFDIIIDSRGVPVSRANHYTEKGLPFEQEGLTFITATKKWVDSDLFDMNKKEYMMIEVQKKMYRRTPVLFNATNNFYYNCEGMSDKDFENAKSISELNFINHVSHHVDIVVFAGNIMLAKEKSLFREINIVPSYANKIGNEWWGKVHEAKDPQRELNKRHSQLVDIVNKMASYGMGVTSEAFESPNDYKQFLKDRNSPGFVTKFKPGFKEHLHEFQGVKYPQEFVGTLQISSQDIQKIMNVFPEMMGGGGANESGVALAHKQRQGLVGNEYLFDNFSLSKRRIGKLLLEAIQIVDSPEKLLRIAENQNNRTLEDSEAISLYKQLQPEEAMQMAAQAGAIQPQLMQAAQQGDPQAQQALQQMLQQMMPQLQNMANQQRRKELISMLDNFEIMDYDLVVAESSYAPTTRLANYMILQQLFANNPNAPFAELLELVPFLDKKTKDKIRAGMQQQAQAQQQADQMKYQTEIQKTMIAKGDNQPQGGAPQ